MTFAVMLTVDLIEGAFRSVIESLRPSIPFIHETNDVMDHSATDAQFPLAAWHLPDEALVENYPVLQDTYTVEILFLDQTSSQRTPAQMAGAHARMSIIAKMVARRFHSRFIKEQGTYDGHPMDLQLVGDIRFLALWDERPDMRTGVQMTMAIRDVGTVECEDLYFV